MTAITSLIPGDCSRKEAGEEGTGIQASAPLPPSWKWNPFRHCGTSAAGLGTAAGGRPAELPGRSLLLKNCSAANRRWAKLQVRLHRGVENWRPAPSFRNSSATVACGQGTSSRLSQSTFVVTPSVLSRLELLLAARIAESATVLADACRQRSG